MIRLVARRLAVGALRCPVGTTRLVVCKVGQVRFLSMGSDVQIVPPVKGVSPIEYEHPIDKTPEQLISEVRHMLAAKNTHTHMRTSLGNFDSYFGRLTSPNCV